MEELKNINFSFLSFNNLSLLCFKSIKLISSSLSSSKKELGIFILFLLFCCIELLSFMSFISFILIFLILQKQGELILKYFL